MRLNYNNFCPEVQQTEHFLTRMSADSTLKHLVPDQDLPLQTAYW